VLRHPLLDPAAAGIVAGKRHDIAATLLLEQGSNLENHMRKSILISTAALALLAGALTFVSLPSRAMVQLSGSNSSQPPSASAMARCGPAGSLAIVKISQS
jgi:hypothetical protein